VSERGRSNSFRNTKEYWVPNSSYTGQSDNDRDTTDPFIDAVNKAFEEAKQLLLSKHRDYGPTNIANAPGGALNGLRVRMHDKTARINHLIDNAKYKNPEHESLRDSFLDLLNYSAIALLVIDGQWPTSDSGPDCD